MCAWCFLVLWYLSREKSSREKSHLCWIRSKFCLVWNVLYQQQMPMQVYKNRGNVCGIFPFHSLTKCTSSASSNLWMMDIGTYKKVSAIYGCAQQQVIFTVWISEDFGNNSWKKNSATLHIPWIKFWRSIHVPNMVYFCKI